MWIPSTELFKRTNIMTYSSSDIELRINALSETK